MTTPRLIPVSVPTHSELGRAARPICGGDHCTSCPKESPAGNAPTARTIDASMLTAGSIFVTSINPGIVKAPEPELTVKQAAKAYRKAVRAYDDAVQAHKDAEAAEAAARRARTEAMGAAGRAQEALEKAAKR